MMSTIKDWLKVMVLLLDEAAAVVVILVVLHFFEVEIPLMAAIVGGLVLGFVVFIVHKKVIPTFHRKQVTGAEGMIGLTGKATGPLTPKGVVRVGDELWQAKSTGEHIPAGEEVEIMALSGLTLTVKRKEE